MINVISVRNARKFILAICFLPALLFAIGADAKPALVSKWGRFEQSFNSSVKYENPLQQCTLQVAFVSPRGETNSIYGFWDGGKTWRKTLAGANGATGCAMIAMSPGEPKTLYAAMWDFRRQGWTFRSGGPGSGLFKSTDGGEHWTELTQSNSKGLPE